MKPRASLTVLALLAACLLGAARNGPARNAILFIGDGMAISTLTAARVHAAGPSGRLALELPHVALVRTHSLDRLVTDSAASATAILAGERVSSGVLGMSPETKRSCSIPKRRDGSVNPLHPCASAAAPIPSLGELAAQAGMAVGVVTTTRVTHATPAALYAHVDEREREADIAAQLVQQPGLNFVVGGGRRFFKPASWQGLFVPGGVRVDGRDLLVELREKGVAVPENGEALRAAVGAGAERIVAVLTDDHFPYVSESSDVPSLAELTELAIRQLSRSEKGYFLLVEGGRIDHAQHENRAPEMLGEMRAFDEAVASARRLTDEKDTLILVTADHSQPLVIAGYALVDDSILGQARGHGIGRKDADGDGKPDLLRASNGEPFSTLLFANGPRSALRLPYATHEGSDVVATAVGPGAERVRGFLDQVELFSVLRTALGL